METKRQNKLLKLAIQRLQDQLKMQPPALLAPQPGKLMGPDDRVEAGDTFITETKRLDSQGISQIQASQEV